MCKRHFLLWFSWWWHIPLQTADFICQFYVLFRFEFTLWLDLYYWLRLDFLFRPGGTIMVFIMSWYHQIIPIYTFIASKQILVTEVLRDSIEKQKTSVENRKCVPPRGRKIKVGWSWGCKSIKRCVYHESSWWLIRKSTQGSYTGLENMENWRLNKSLKLR